MSEQYYYGYLFRPPMPGAQPREGLNVLYCDDVQLPCGRSLWGYAIYDRKLTEKEKADYELIELVKVWRGSDGRLQAEISGADGKMDSRK